jgi:hypothetical protein
MYGLIILVSLISGFWGRATNGRIDMASPF